MSDYKKAKQKYDFYIRLALLSVLIPFLYCLLARENVTLIILSFIVYVVLSFIVLVIFSIWHSNILKELLDSRNHLESWRQFIQINSAARFRLTKLQAKFAAILYNYMMGDFALVIKETEELEDRNNLTQQQKNKLEKHFISAVILSKSDLTKSELQDMISRVSIANADVKKEIKERSEAIYDIVIAHQVNEYFEHISDESKFSQLEILYFKALNCLLKGNETKAKELFNIIIKEDNELYIVRESKKYFEMKDMSIDKC